MSYYGNIKDAPDPKESYENHCVDGKCSGCGECCVDLLPVTPQEIERIRKFVEKYDLKEHRQAPFWDPNATDMTCPFRNQHEHKCDIYPVRPYICRNFICSKSIAQAHKDRDRIHNQTHGTVSLRWEIFGNPECVAYLTGICLREARIL